MSSHKKTPSAVGAAYVVLATVIFGITPAFAALSYRGGNNGMNMAFLRAVLPLPILLVLTWRDKRATRGQILRAVLVGLALYGFSITSYLSYTYISVGTSTTLQFLYVPMVALFEWLIKRQRSGRRKLMGYALSLLGTVLFMDFASTQMDGRGIVLAVLSAAFYAGYVILLDYEAQNPLPMYQLTLYISLTGAVATGIAGMLLGSLTLRLTTSAWLYAAATALLMVLVGCALFQAGVRKVGQTPAAVLSLLQLPVSVLAGMLMMGDALNAMHVIGCTVILIGLVISTIPSKASKKHKANAEDKR